VCKNQAETSGFDLRSTIRKIFFRPNFHHCLQDKQLKNIAVSIRTTNTLFPRSVKGGSLRPVSLTDLVYGGFVYARSGSGENLMACLFAG
jgi:hypothetical protein